MDLVQQSLAVLLVLALLGAVVFMARNRGFAAISLPGRSAKPRRMESLERLALTPNHSLHLIAVDGKVHLVGVSPTGCHLLQERS